jgi:MFS family permease
VIVPSTVKVANRLPCRKLELRYLRAHNGDDVFIAWKPEGFISSCRGFSSLRLRNGIEEAALRATSIPAIPRTVWMLGFVSLFMDMSSELVHCLLPVFLVSTLGASVMTVGVIEGLAEAATLIAKVFSGAMSDYFRRRKGLILLGYGMAALTKPLFPLATSAETVFIARFLDRIGKGIRGAPRDALVADVASLAIRGARFGLRQSMDTVGAFLGPSAAILMMYWFASDIRQVLWFAVVPACVTVFLILLGVEDPKGTPSGDRFRSPIIPGALREFSSDYWRVVAIGAIFTLARFSEAFLVLRAQQAGFAITWVPIVMIVMSLTYSLSAYPAGILSDRVSRRYLLAAGIVLLIMADLVLAWAGSPPMVVVGVALWGLHMGCTQGILAAMIAEVTPAELKGTAFGLFNLASGLFMLLASMIAGGLWETYGAAITFCVGAVLSLSALVMLISLAPSGGGSKT